VLLLLDDDTEQEWKSTPWPTECRFDAALEHWIPVNSDVAFANQKAKVDKLQKKIQEASDDQKKKESESKTTVDDQWKKGDNQIKTQKADKKKRLEKELTLENGELKRWGQFGSCAVARADECTRRRNVRDRRQRAREAGSSRTHSPQIDTAPSYVHRVQSSAVHMCCCLELLISLPRLIECCLNTQTQRL
jgi:hypothetical protein